jgi:hypothetical protein
MPLPPTKALTRSFVLCYSVADKARVTLHSALFFLLRNMSTLCSAALQGLSTQVFFTGRIQRIEISVKSGLTEMILLGRTKPTYDNYNTDVYAPNNCFSHSIVTMLI